MYQASLDRPANAYAKLDCLMMNEDARKSKNGAVKFFRRVVAYSFPVFRDSNEIAL